MGLEVIGAYLYVQVSGVAGHRGYPLLCLSCPRHAGVSGFVPLLFIYLLQSSRLFSLVFLPILGLCCVLPRLSGISWYPVCSYDHGLHESAGLQPFLLLLACVFFFSGTAPCCHCAWTQHGKAVPLRDTLGERIVFPLSRSGSASADSGPGFPCWWE